MLRIYLTGRVAIEGSAAIVDEADLPGPLGRVLLAALALYPGPVARSRAADILWDETPPEVYDRSLNPLLSKLRRAIVGAGGDRHALVSGSGAIELRRRADVWIDVVEATTALDAAEGALRRNMPRQAWPRAAVATSVFGRPFLEGVDLRWVIDQRRSLHDRLIRAYQATADVWIQMGDPGQAVVAARRLVDSDPFRETGYERLIRAHVLAGNRAEALRTFRMCADILRDELGVEPSPLVQSAYEQALRVAQ